MFKKFLFFLGRALFTPFFLFGGEVVCWGVMFQESDIPSYGWHMTFIRPSDELEELGLTVNYNFELAV